MGIDPTAFYSSSPREMNIAIEGYRDGRKEQFNLSQIAMMNAIGIFFGGKQFKVTNPFDEIKEEKTVTPEEKRATFELLQDRFGEKDGENK